MKTLFTLLKSGTQKFPIWENARRGLSRNTERVLQYYRNNPTIVKSNHFLVKLIQSIAIPHGLNTERYYDNVENISTHLAMAMKMTSSTYKGSLFNSVFYPGSNEIIISRTNEINLEVAVKNWRQLVPVKVIRHPISDLGLALPDGTQDVSETGLAVIMVDIPLLALQYRAFCQHEEYTKGSDGAQLTVMQFVRMYVIPNMLVSHVDYVIFNRLDKLSRNEQPAKYIRQHPFVLIDYSQEVDDVLLRAIDLVSNQVNTFSKTIQTVPAVFNENQAYLAFLPEMAQTRQVLWALILAKLPLILFLFNISKGGPSNVNQDEVNAIVSTILINNVESVFRVQLTGDLFKEVSDELKYIKSFY